MNSSMQSHPEKSRSGKTDRLSVVIVTSIHPDFDARIWKHAQMVARAGHRVRLVCPWDVEPGSVRNGVEFHPFPKAPSRRMRAVWVPLKLLPVLLRAARGAGILHFHDLDLLPWMTPFAAFKTVVYDVHENYPDEMLCKTWLPAALRRPVAFAVKWGQWACSRIIRNVVLVAPSQERYFTSLMLRKIYLYNFATEDIVASVCDDYAERKPTVVFTGSQYENNGSLLLLEIAAKVVKENPEIGFLAVDRFADAGFRERFLRRRAELGLDDAVRLVANVKPHEIMSILNQGTIAISPNLRVPLQIKAIPTKLFEYMVAGLPMVLSDLPNQMEVLATSRAGIAAAPERPEDFARAILDLTADRDAAMAMGRRGQAAFLTSYCYESQEGKLIGFYRRITGSA